MLYIVLTGFGVKTQPHKKHLHQPNSLKTLELYPNPQLYELKDIVLNLGYPKYLKTRKAYDKLVKHKVLALNL